MPISIRFHESRLYLVARFAGKIQDHELQPAYSDFYRDNDVPLNLPELVDLSAADLGGLTHAGLTAFSRWVEDFLRGRGETAHKSALFMPSYVDRSKLVIYEVLTQGSPEITRVFSRLDEAERWLLDASPQTATSLPMR